MRRPGSDMRTCLGSGAEGCVVPNSRVPWGLDASFHRSTSLPSALRLDWRGAGMRQSRRLWGLGGVCWPLAGRLGLVRTRRDAAMGRWRMIGPRSLRRTTTGRAPRARTEAWHCHARGRHRRRRGGHAPDVARCPDPDAVRQENQRQGTPGGASSAGPTTGRLKATPLEATVTRGRGCRWPCPSAEARGRRWFVYRLGYYGGRGGPARWRGAGPCAASQAGRVPSDSDDGRGGLPWTPTLEIARRTGCGRVPGEAGARGRPGALRALLRAGVQPRSEVVAVIPTATWAAYNTWGGTSL